MEETHTQALEVQILFLIKEKVKTPFSKLELVEVLCLLHIYCRRQINGGEEKKKVLLY